MEKRIAELESQAAFFDAENRILEVVFCEDDDNPLKNVKTAEPITRTRWGKEND